MIHPPKIRIATAKDQPGIFALVEDLYTDFGYVASQDLGEADLVDLKTHYFDKGGCFWVLEDTNQIVGTHGYLPCQPGTHICTFRRLYLARDYRGTEWGQRLMQVTIDWAREQGMQRIEFWSDTHYSRAHRFLEKFGFTLTDRIREMHDGLQPYQERFCFLDLD